MRDPIRSTWMTVSLATAVLAAGCGEADTPAPPMADDEGTFVALLGTDTLAVERYTLSPERMEVLAVTRSPRTLHREVVVEFNPEGELTRYESRVLDPSGPAVDLLQRSIVTYQADSVTVATETPDGMDSQRRPGGPRMVPLSFNHFSLVELAIRRALHAGDDRIELWSNGPTPVEVRRSGPDSVYFVTEALGTWNARVDADGRILEMHAGALGRDVERAPDLDVDAVARRWREADARGEGMGVLSPRDTARATVAGASITVDYSRPAARGRQVFGGLVPYGELWRTGADQATHLTTDRPLRLGSETIPAGTYTLFTIPERDRWTLIVNRQTGQAGTEYDPEQDLLRVDMETRPLEEPENRFTILVESGEGGGVLRLIWEGVEARIGFQVE